ncbi:MAG: hypothetical protein ACK57P_11515 [Planctomycetota bacterium]
MEWIVGLFFLWFGLLLWAAIGHGLWVLGASIFSVTTPRSCPACRRAIDAEDRACRYCGWSSVSADALQGLKVCRNAIEGAFARKLIDEETRQRGFHVLGQLEEQLSRERRGERPLDRVPTPIPTPPDTPSPPVIATVVPPTVAPPTVAPPAVAAPSPVPSSPVPSSRLGEHVHALDREYPKAKQVDAPKLPSARSWSQWMSAFLEESNIRWGELVGGLLIVCCSVALVISFWENIASRPWLKFSIFTGINMATFGLGLYAWHRWKLPTTSKGILVIGMMLLPLNFLAFALFTLGMTWDWFTVGGEMVSLAILGALAWQAAKVLTPSSVWITTLTPIAFALANLLIRRTVSDGADIPLLYGWGTGLLGLNAAAIGLAWKPLFKQAEGRFAPALEFYALATFGFLLAGGLLLRCSGQPMQSFIALSPLLSLLAAPALIIALDIGRKIPKGSSLTIPMLLLAACAIGVGAASMLFSFPVPGRLIGAALGWLVLIGVVAARERHASLGYPVYLTLSMIAVLAWYCFTGQLAWTNESPQALWTQIASPTTGFLWVGCSLVCGAISIGLAKRPWPNASLTALRSAAIIGVLGTILLTALGFGREAYSTSVGAVYGIYAAAAFAIGVVRKKPWVEGVGIFFLAAAAVQGIAVGWVDSHWMVRAFACLASVSTALAIVMMIKRAIGQPADRESILAGATVSGISLTTLVALAWFFLDQTVPWPDSAPFSIGTLASAVLLWFLFSWLYPDANVWRITQWVAIGCGLVEVALRCQRSAWWEESPNGYLHPMFLQYAALTLFVSGSVLIALHEIFRRGSRGGWSRLASPFIDLHDSSVGHYVISTAAFAMLGLLVYGAAPGTIQELIPRNALETTELVSFVQDGDTRGRTVPSLQALELSGIPHAAGSWGIGSDRYRVWWLPPMTAAWGIGLLALVAAFWNARHEVSKPRLVWMGLAITLFLALWYPIASRFESSVAVASALRWLTTIFFFFASLGLSVWIQRVDREREPEASRLFARFDSLFSVISINAMVPWFAMVTIVLVSVLQRVPDMPGSLWAWSITGLMAMCAMVLALVQFSHGYSASQNQMRSVAAITASTLLAAPLVTWVILQVAIAVIANPLTGPNPDSMFARMGLAASYAIPILLISFALVTVSAARPSPHLAFISAIFLMVTVVVGYMLILKSNGMRVEAWIGLTAALSATASIFSIIWRAYTARDTRSDALLHWSGRPAVLVRGEWQTALRQVSTGFLLVGLVLIAGIVLYHPASMAGLNWASGGILVATSILFIDRYFQRAHAELPPWIGAAGIAGMGIIAPVWSAVDASLVSCAILMTVTGAAMIAASVRRANSFSVLIWIVGILACIAIRLVGQKVFFAGPWTGVGLVPVVVLLAAWALAIANAWLHRDRWSWLVGLLTAQAAGLIFTLLYRGGSGFTMERGWDTIFAQCAILALSSGIGTCLGFGRLVRIPVIVATLVLALCSGLWLVYAMQVNSTQSIATFPIGWYAVAIGSSIVAGMTGFWSSKSRDEHAVVYVSGLSGVVCMLQAVAPHAGVLLWLATAFFAAYCLGTSFLWRAGARIHDELARAIRLPKLPEKSPANLVVTMNIFLAVFVASMGVAAQFLQENLGFRFICANAIMAVAFASGILARYVSMWSSRPIAMGSTVLGTADAQGTGSSFIRVLSLALGILYAVTLFWHVQPIQSTTFLDRLSVSLLPLTLIGAAYGFGLIKGMGLKQEWEQAAFWILPWIVVASIVGGIACLGIEYDQTRWSSESHLDVYPTLCVALSFVLAMLLCLAAAMLPGRDPLGLSQRGREAYVYTTQAILVLLIIHLRLVLPWLFSGWLQQVWPLFFLVLGFGGMAVADWAERRGWSVLANPLRNSGGLLPLLPILAPWISQSEIDYGVTLVTAAIGYGLFGFMRRSPIYITASALAANGAIWYMLQRNEFSFARHPQLWVIPPALCVFAAVQLARHRLTAGQIATARYASIGSIYVASTSEIFLQGIAKAPWLPIVLAFLSVLGILFGIAARIRSMLWLGSMFLCVALLSILWYAAVDLEQTWIWYVSGIVLGAVILVVFALFEKRREDLKRIMNTMQQWEE